MSEVEGLWGEAKRFFRQLASKRGSGSGEDYGGGDYGEGEGGSSGDGDGDVKSLVGEQLGDAGPQVGAVPRAAWARRCLRTQLTRTPVCCGKCTTSAERMILLGPSERWGTGHPGVVPPLCGRRVGHGAVTHSDRAAMALSVVPIADPAPQDQQALPRRRARGAAL